MVFIRLTALSSRTASSPCYYRRWASSALSTKQSSASSTRRKSITSQTSVSLRMKTMKNTSRVRQPISSSSLSPLVSSSFSTSSFQQQNPLFANTKFNTPTKANEFMNDDKTLFNDLIGAKYFSASSHMGHYAKQEEEEQLDSSNHGEIDTNFTSARTATKSYSGEDYMDIISNHDPTKDKHNQHSRHRKNGANGRDKPSQKNKLQTRANVKLNALSNVKSKANHAKIAYQDASSSSSDNKKRQLLLKEWIQSEIQLSKSFSQAIKYVGRCSSVDTGSSSKAERLVDDWIRRIGVVTTNNSSKSDDEEDENAPKSRRQKNNAMIEMLNDDNSPATHFVKSSILDVILNNANDDKKQGMIIQQIIPQRRDFNNILHSWASSKARRKGLHAEALLLRMVELSCLGYSKEEEEEKKRLFDTVPDSKAFALAVKCFANSTFNQSLPKIMNLHNIHNAYADKNIVGIYRNDPFFLMHSLKALKNYRKPDEARLVKDWLMKLHSFVIDPSNNSYVLGDVDNDDDDESVATATSLSADSGGNAVKINLAGTYTAIIREYARLRATKGAASDAREVLDMMHELMEKSCDDDGPTIATMDIKANSYNLVLGSYRDSGEEKYARAALELLERMLDAARMTKSVVDDGTATGDNTYAPLPTEQSFEFCIQSLASLRDYNLAFQEARRLVDEFESLCVDAATTVDNSQKDGFPFRKPSPAVHNALIELCNKSTADRSTLLDTALGVVKRIEEFAEKFPTASPDEETWAHILKTCSYVRGDYDVMERALSTADDIFEKLEKGAEASSENVKSVKINDKCYFHMMKCVVSLSTNEEESRERLLKLFSDACEKGFVSANVLGVFKANVSNEEFTTMAGEGRLADKWVANVTSGKALYTDGTMGGAGKHAFRKGKSTSGWAKKQRRRTEEIMQRKEAKAKRRMQRKNQK